MTRGERIVKKYPNRRLYDTESSSYITLLDAKHLVNEKVKFRVKEARTNKDITNVVLLQILTQDELDEPAQLHTELLRQMIQLNCNYKRTETDSENDYLVQLKLLLDDQREEKLNGADLKSTFN